MTQTIRTTKCFRCKQPKVVSIEIGSSDMRAICYACLTGRTTEEAVAAVNVPAKTVDVAPVRVMKTQRNHNRTNPQ